MKRTKLFPFLASIIILAITINACKKKDNDTEGPIINKAPYCSILNPGNGTQISLGESITIEVDATDDDGQVQKVEFFINNSLKETVNASPYQYIWDTKTLSVGNYNISVNAYDNEGKSTSTNIDIDLIDGSVSSGDTIIPGNFLNASSMTIYTATDNNGNYMGYMIGSNAYKDKAKAQQFRLGSSTYTIKGGIFWIGTKHVAGNANLKLNLWAMDGTTGSTTQGDGNQTCPNTELAAKLVPVSDIDTSSALSGAHIELFDTPIEVVSDYAMGIDMENLYATGDTIALVSSADGDGNGMELAWEQWSDSSWHTFLKQTNGWGVDLDIAIFPILASDAAKVGGEGFAFGMKLSKAKRSFSREQLKIEYEIEETSQEVILEVLDLTGNKIISKNLGSKSEGIYSTFISKNNLPKGKYIYTLQANGNKLAKELIVN